MRKSTVEGPISVRKSDYCKWRLVAPSFPISIIKSSQNLRQPGPADAKVLVQCCPALELYRIEQCLTR
jgi:hypothetical protein